MIAVRPDLLAPKDAVGRTVFLLCPRNVNTDHGTGVQLLHLATSFPDTVQLINYGCREYRTAEAAITLSGPVANAWPLRYRGRRWWSRFCEQLGFESWRNDQLTERGKNALRRLNVGGVGTTALAVVSSLADARRLNEIHLLTGVPYGLLCYDFIDTAEDDSELRRCFSKAQRAWAISEPLADLARKLGVGRVDPVHFFRSKPAEPFDPPKGDADNVDVNLLVMSHFDFRALDELVDLIHRCNGQIGGRTVRVHVVGNSDRWRERRRDLPAWMTFHGRVTDAARDLVVAGCDIAFLAGPAGDPNTCPFARWSLPSKLGDFAAFGLPTVAWVSEGSAAAITISARLEGFVQVVNQPSALKGVLEKMILDPAEQNRRSAAARRYADTHVLLPASIDGLMREILDLGSRPIGSD